METKEDRDRKVEIEQEKEFVGMKYKKVDREKKYSKEKMEDRDETE